MARALMPRTHAAFPRQVGPAPPVESVAMGAPLGLNGFVVACANGWVRGLASRSLYLQKAVLIVGPSEAQFTCSTPAFIATVYCLHCAGYRLGPRFQPTPTLSALYDVRFLIYHGSSFAGRIKTATRI